MWHPVDSLAWKIIKFKWSKFSNDPRNVKLVMELDGFNHLETSIVHTVFG